MVSICKFKNELDLADLGWKGPLEYRLDPTMVIPTLSVHVCSLLYISSMLKMEDANLFFINLIDFVIKIFACMI